MSGHGTGHSATERNELTENQREPAVRLIDFSVSGYKNLTDVRLDFTDVERLLLFGRNGVGKTNLLECLGLAFGSAATMWQLAPRAVAPPAGSITALVQGTSWNLPLGPSLSLVDRPEGTETPLREMAQAGDFWTLLGADQSGGLTWEEGIRSTVGDQRLQDLLIEAQDAPLIRYELESVTGLDEARAVDRGSEWLEDAIDEAGEAAFTRSFSRTLMISELPGWLADVADDLPNVFLPLQNWVDSAPEERSGPVPLMLLPVASRTPVHVTWIAAERSHGEALFDLWDAYERNLGRVTELLLELASFQTHPDAERTDEQLEADARWALINLVSSNIARGLSTAFPDVSVNPVDDDLYGIDVDINGRTTRPLAEEGLDWNSLSSGERTWLDRGLASAAAAIEVLGREAEALTSVIQTLDIGAAGAVLLDLDHVMEQQADEGYWLPDLLTDARAQLSGLLADVSAPRNHDEATRRFVRLNSETLATAMTPSITLDVYDEPERHLEIRAQRAVRRGLAAAEELTVIATHSHVLLGSADWQHVHVARDGSGEVSTKTFDPSKLDVLSSVARDIGLTSGELLSRYSFVLIVEGVVDQIVLEGLHGRQLREAGVLLLPLEGVDEAKSLLELRLIGTLWDIDCGLLADNTREDWLEHRSSRPAKSKEERVISGLAQLLRKRGKKMAFFGLEQADIIRYVDEDRMRDRFPEFSGWADVDREARGRGFKQALQEACGVRVDAGHVQQVVKAMAQTGRSHPEIDRVVEQVLSKAREA